MLVVPPMAELLLELFSEEIPARMQGRARADLARLLGDGLKGAGLEFNSVRSFATPRRLTVVIDGLPALSPDVHEERKGPRVAAPDAAIQGFLKSAGLKTVEQAERREDKKGEYYVALLEKLGRATAEIVAEIVPDGRIIPFCAYNSVGYREQVREQQSALAGNRSGALSRPITNGSTADAPRPVTG